MSIFDKIRLLGRNPEKKSAVVHEEGNSRFLDTLPRLGRRDKIDELSDEAKEGIVKQLAEISSFNQIEVSVDRFDSQKLKDAKVKSTPTFMIGSTSSGRGFANLGILELKPVALNPDPTGQSERIEYLVTVQPLDEQGQKPRYVRFVFVLAKSKDEGSIDIVSGVRKIWHNFQDKALMNEDKYGQFSWIAGVNANKFT